MTQNTKTILLTIFACLVLITGFEIGSGRIRFGNAYFNDSTPSLVALNKGILVNGKLSTSNYADLNNGVRFADTDIYIDDDGLDLRYSVETNGSHIFSTKSLTTLMTVDSIYGFATKIEGLASIGWGSAPVVRTKLIRGVAPTGNSTVTYAHGVTDGRIINCNIWLRHDTTATSAYHAAANWYVQPGAYYDATILYYAGFDSLYCWARFPAAATATRGDSLYFVLTYIDPL